jgi:diguanylate cyclase (GGDEF)-like protein
MPEPDSRRDVNRNPGLMVRDALTGVYAKVALLERLEEEVHRGRRYGESFSILLLDLDYFKSVNDAFGHARGDATLAEFVARVQLAARNSDVLFRFGGDEFLLFLPRTSHEQATILAERLVEQVSGSPFSGQPPLSLTVSIGVATMPDDATTAEDLLARADARMYEAKREGRSRVVSVDPSRDAEVMLDEGTRLIERLDALDRANRFFDTLPSARSGVLRIIGASGSGLSRVLREMEKLARLRGQRVLSILPAGIEPLSALRAALNDTALLPDGVLEIGSVADALRQSLAADPNTIAIITIDDMADVDHATMEVVRALTAPARTGSPIGVIHTGFDQRVDPLPHTPFRDTIELRPLSHDGVRAWMRSIFRWEPPAEFVEWTHEQTRGLPGAVRTVLLQLVDRRLLVRDEGKWTLAESFREIRPYKTDLGEPPRGVRLPRNVLIGREDAVRQLLRLVRTTRLISVVGPGGSGKTRLATEVALEAADALGDGVAFVHLGQRMSSVQLATAIANTLGISALEGPNPWIALGRQIRNRRMLLILDAVEDVVEVPNAVATLLEYSADLHILATTRHRLNLKDEWVFHLEGLRAPKWPEVERARSYSAVQLFVERANMANAHLPLGDSDAANLARVAQLLDGSPLAIELAGALVSASSTREIADEMDVALGGIATYLPATPADQQRFRAIMEQTWRLMPEELRWVLRRASVFVDEFDAAAASQVIHAEPTHLNRLVELGVAYPVSADRYALHPMVREYATQKLSEFARDRHEVSVAHATYYLELARELGEDMRAAATVGVAVARFTAELGNLRKAWGFALTEDMHGLLQNSLNAWFEYFAQRKYRADAEAHFADAINWLDMGNHIGVAVDERLYGMMLARHGAALLHVGRVHDARLRLTAALSIAGRQGRDSEEALCLRYLALVEDAAGSPNTAEEYARASILFARRSADPHALVLALRDAAGVASRAGASQRAVELLLEAVGVEAASSAKASAWRALLEAVTPMLQNPSVPLPGAVLNQIISDGTAEPEILAGAQRLLDSLRVIHEPVIGGDSIIAFPR